MSAAQLSDSVGAFGDKHVACPIDYFEASIADQLRAKLGATGVIRTVAPVCGDVAQFERSRPVRHHSQDSVYGIRPTAGLCTYRILE